MIGVALGALLRAVDPPLEWMIVSVVKWTVVFGRFEDVAPIPPFRPIWIYVAQFVLQAMVSLAMAYLLAVWVYGEAGRRVEQPRVILKQG
jgi:hypothetical protein